MGSDWVKILSTTDRYKAEIYHGLLEEHDIKSIIMNRQDSAYIFIGEVELYVNRDDILKAMTILKLTDQ